MTDLPTTAEELGNLAQQGAIALVGAMATGVFQAARTGIGRVFGRLEPNRQARIEEQLDEEERLVIAAEGGRDQAREALASGWELRLKQLLKDLPEVEPELRDLISRLQAALPKAQQQWVQTNVASGHGTVLAAQGGDVIYHQTTGKQAPPASDDL